MGIKAGKEKYARKTAVMGDNWARMKPIMKRHYKSEMDKRAREVGKPGLLPTREKAYNDGVEAVSADDFRSAVTGKEDKWYDNYVAAMFGA